MKPWAIELRPGVSNEAAGSQIKALGSQCRMLSMTQIGAPGFQTNPLGLKLNPRLSN